MQLDQKLVNGKCDIRRTPCACNARTNMLEKTRVICVELIYQPRYQTVKDYRYWPVIGSVNNWNIIQFSNKSTTYEDFDEVHILVLDGISENMSSIFQNGKYKLSQHCISNHARQLCCQIHTITIYVIRKYNSEKQVINASEIISNAVLFDHYESKHK